MTERKWTPGPWVEREKGVHPHPYVCGEYKEYEFGLDRPVVCYLVGCRTEANAHLIAAAPDLYEALEEIIKVHGEAGPVSAKAIAALAKARGE